MLIVDINRVGTKSCSRSAENLRKAESMKYGSARKDGGMFYKICTLQKIADECKKCGDICDYDNCKKRLAKIMMDYVRDGIGESGRQRN